MVLLVAISTIWGFIYFHVSESVKRAWWEQAGETIQTLLPTHCLLAANSKQWGAEGRCSTRLTENKQKGQKLFQYRTKVYNLWEKITGNNLSYLAVYCKLSLCFKWIDTEGWLLLKWNVFTSLDQIWPVFVLHWRDLTSEEHHI